MIQTFSSMGAYHRINNGENQDALYYDKNESRCVISLADGVSTCSNAKCGSEIASRAITDLLFKKGNCLFDFTRDQIARFALDHIRYELKRKAEEESNDIEGYSSTVASVLIDKKKGRMLCINIGDSVIIASGKGKSSLLSLPASSSAGCCVTTTQNAQAMASVKVLDTGSLDSVVICSDGAWHQMFHKNKLKPEVEELITGNAYPRLKSYLAEQNNMDDCSFIAFSKKSVSGADLNYEKNLSAKESDDIAL